MALGETLCKLCDSKFRWLSTAVRHVVLSINLELSEVSKACV